MERPIGRIQFGAALFLASIFKILAVLTLIGGAFVTLAGATALNETARNTGFHQPIAGFVGAGVAGTVVTSSFLAFFGYVLEILVETYDQVWHIRYNDEDEADDLEHDEA